MNVNEIKKYANDLTNSKEKTIIKNAIDEVETNYANLESFLINNNRSMDEMLDSFITRKLFLNDGEELDNSLCLSFNCDIKGYITLVDNRLEFRIDLIPILEHSWFETCSSFFTKDFHLENCDTNNLKTILSAYYTQRDKSIYEKLGFVDETPITWLFTPPRSILREGIVNWLNYKGFTIVDIDQYDLRFEINI